MPLRDKLAARATPYLEPGEQIQAIFLAQSGASPYWIFLSAIILIVSAGYRTVVVTDRAIVILRNGRLIGTRPKAVHLRGPRNVWLGTPSGLWGKVQLDVRYWVHKRFHKDVAAADAALRAMGGQPRYPGQQPAGYPQQGQPQGGYPAQHPGAQYPAQQPQQGGYPPQQPQQQYPGQPQQQFAPQQYQQPYPPQQGYPPR